jgi:hypothetical protein
MMSGRSGSTEVLVERDGKFNSKENQPPATYDFDQAPINRFSKNIRTRLTKNGDGAPFGIKTLEYTF